LRFGLFNLFFISIYQHLLILLISFPLLFAAVYPEKAVAILDLVAGALMLGFIITETIADNQQFQFQREKRAGRTDGNRFQESLRKGFIMEGLWSYARHPNFASEQGIWISFYFFGVAASGQWINVTITGPLLLVLLFAGSTRFTESISSRKYPGYALYQKEVPKFIPIRMRYRSART
jgi:steroid 5-alpha reductase family enzyme